MPRFCTAQQWWNPLLMETCYQAGVFGVYRCVHHSTSSYFTLIQAPTLLCRARYEPAMQATDKQVVQGLEAAGIIAVGHEGHLLYEPQGVRVNMREWKGHFGTLMPFLKCAPACDRLACYA